MTVRNLVIETIWLVSLTEGEDLPEQDAVGPDVRQAGVKVVEDALWGHPLQGKEGLVGTGHQTGLTGGFHHLHRVKTCVWFCLLRNK